MSTITQIEIVRLALDNSGYQLEKVFEGISAEHWNAKANPVEMSPAETAEHLCEVYTAFKTMGSGGNHEWGTYSSGETTQAGLMSLVKRLRAEAVEMASTTDTPEMAKAAMDYIALHDCYHVGQMVVNRMATDPSWDAYSIYPGS